MERERSHFISISNSSKLNQHESGSSLPKLKGKAILFVGSYPPPYGGGSSLLAGLGKSFESVGCKYHVLHFYGKTEPSEKIDGAIVHRIKNKAVLPHTNQAWDSKIDIPAWPGIIETDLEKVVNAMRSALDKENQ
jgi:hypothetical protein